MKNSFFDFEVLDSKQANFPLSQFKGKVVLVVNVASKCGFTGQYTGLEELYKNHREKGLVVLGFPCNQFGAQEPGSDAEIQKFCSLTYNVTFPVLAKVDVNGDNTSPVYEFLKANGPGLLGTEAIKWNFTKFLIGRDGKVVKRFAPQDKPSDLVKDIAALL